MRAAGLLLEQFALRRGCRAMLLSRGIRIRGGRSSQEYAEWKDGLRDKETWSTVTIWRRYCHRSGRLFLRNALPPPREGGAFILFSAQLQAPPSFSAPSCCAAHAHLSIQKPLTGHYNPLYLHPCSLVTPSATDMRYRYPPHSHNGGPSTLYTVWTSLTTRLVLPSNVLRTPEACMLLSMVITQICYVKEKRMIAS